MISGDRLVSSVLFVLMVAGPGSGRAFANEFHPDVPLLDKSGSPVVQSGQPLSTMATCGACHDTVFIAASSDHADAGANQLGSEGGRHDWQAGPGYYGVWDPTRYDSALQPDGRIDPELWLLQSGSRHVGGGPVAGLLEMDCLLCHSDLTDSSERTAALNAGDFAWANSAPLRQRDVLNHSGGNWQWNPAMFKADGSLVEGVLPIRKPRDANCAQCHGQVGDGLETPLSLHDEPALRYLTERTGQIISPQKIFQSGLNIAGKESLTRPFDVHADRVVACVNCHYSLNNPVYFQQSEESRPAHLGFDPRRLSNAEYLQKPLHQFAKGRSAYGLAAAGSENSLRRCESCHEAGNVHQWLPYRQRHFTALACESCHVPELYGPALETLDWTLVDHDGQPRRDYRNVEGDPASAETLIQAYRPVLLGRENRYGQVQLAPFNLVSSWYWVAGSPERPVKREQLHSALYVGENLHPDLLDALDANQDGVLNDAEKVLDTPERAWAVQERLSASGLEGVHLVAEITPYPISHDVVNGKWATRQCATCHGKASILNTGFRLSGDAIGGLLPAVLDAGGSHSGARFGGSVQVGADGRVEYLPSLENNGFYIIGLDGVPLVDRIGALLVFAVMLGVAGHALARYYFNRQRRRQNPQSAGQETRVVYMYERYERLWHWLQASAILLLLATGLIIHKPHLFGMFSFSYVVQVHNVLGFILLINAALALFYNLTTGELRQYLPEPKGFIGRSIKQAMYYSRGIFAGEPHPLEKTRERKLNPLQQVTYLAILNFLLPAQILTGVLIWGLQQWPQIAASVGGLPVLAPVHTLLAWAFAAFIVMHVYLTTAAGDTPAAGIKSMISGWEKVEHNHGASQADGKES